MPETTSGETANRLRRRIVESSLFLFLATGNSIASRWCPWELGYADGKKPYDSIAIVPTSDGLSTYGNEYLQIYRRIDAVSGALRLIRPSEYMGSPVTSL